MLNRIEALPINEFVRKFQSLLKNTISSHVNAHYVRS